MISAGDTRITRTEAGRVYDALLHAGLDFDHLEILGFSKRPDEDVEILHPFFGSGGNPQQNFTQLFIARRNFIFPDWQVDVRGIQRTREGFSFCYGTMEPADEEKDINFPCSDFSKRAALLLFGTIGGLDVLDPVWEYSLLDSWERNIIASAHAYLVEHTPK